MKFKELKNQIKEEQKQLAHQIRALKQKRKQSPNGYVYGLYGKRSTYRHIHIAYCQFFNNTPYEIIENHCNERPNTSIIDKHMNKWFIDLDENVCDCA